MVTDPVVLTPEAMKQLVKQLPRVADVPLKIKRLSDAQRERYGAAIGSLRGSALGRDPRDLRTALSIAIHHSEYARQFDWAELDLRKRISAALTGWRATKTAAKRLAWHFEKLDEHTASMRLAAALAKAGMQMRVLPNINDPLHLVFARFLNALAKQTATRKSGEYRIGPLRVAKSSRKRPSSAIILTLALAHLFERVLSNKDRELHIFLGQPISGGQAWDVAADFASAALGKIIDRTAAKKFLHDHRGRLYYQGWPNRP